MTHERIEIVPAVMLGKPVIRGTRIAVEHVLRKLAAGLSSEDAGQDHPRLTIDDVRAEAYAADCLADEEIAFG